MDTDRSTILVAAPSRLRAPVIIKSSDPVPVKVFPKLIVDPCNVRSPPDKVTAPV